MKIASLLAKMLVGAVAASTVLVGVAGGTQAFATPGDDIAADGVITITEVRESTTGELVQAMKKLSGADDAHLPGGQKQLLAVMEADGLDMVAIPVFVPEDPAASTGDDASYGDQTEASLYPATIGMMPAAALNDASITYRKGNTSSPSTLHVCRNWLSTGSGCYSGHGYLGNGQNSQSAFGWSDTDGYYNASYMKTEACAFNSVCYTFTTTGWIKTGGILGGTWTVRAWNR